jgi:hypothetical protein
MPGPDLKTNHIHIDVMGNVDEQIRDELERAVPMMIMWDPADRYQVSLIINHSIIFDVEQMRRNHKAGLRSCEILIMLPRGERPRVLIPVDLLRRTM